MNTTLLSATQPEDMTRSRILASRFLAAPARLPISFRLDGTTITGIPERWKPVTSKRRIDANIMETVFEGRDAKTGLGIRAECVEYLDYPVVDTDTTYVLTNPETGATEEKAGEVLVRAGFTMGLPKRSAAIWFYRRKAL